MALCLHSYMVYVYSIAKRRLQRRNAGRDARAWKAGDSASAAVLIWTSRFLSRCPDVHDLAGKKSGTVAGSTPGIRRFGRGGTGAWPGIPALLPECQTEDSPRSSQKFVGVDHYSLPCDARSRFPIITGSASQSY